MIKRIFEFDQYKDFVREHIKSFPKAGRGQFQKIAKLLGIHTTMVTHIFRGSSHLSVEQTLKLAKYFALSEPEKEYFVTLVQYERAANSESRGYFEKNLHSLKARALDLSERLHAKQTLDERDQAIFYSAWYYSTIRLITTIRECRSAETIASAIGLSLPTTARAIEFLLSVGLLRQVEGKYVVGEAFTYVNRDSRWAAQHHLNWRLKSIEQLQEISEEELVFTNSISLSRKDFLRIREEIVKLIETFKKIGDPSPSEQICFLNIDWRQLKLANLD